VAMMLFHSFPRPKPVSQTAETVRNTAEGVLSAILRYGLLCTPERLRVFSDPNTQNPRKQELLRQGEPEFTHSQSRLCFTLCEPEELFQPKIRGLTPGLQGPTATRDAERSHADLFGPFAIGLDPLASRQIGIVPAVYYSPSDRFGRRFNAEDGVIAGLNIQIIQRLKELRELCILLAYIERDVDIDGPPLPGDEILNALHLSLPFEAKVAERVRNLSLRQRKELFALFNIDRESALSFVSFIEMMFSLFQETDSHIDGSVLAFYQQREWRLIHHMREGTSWYCLGPQPAFRNPFAPARSREIRELRRLVSLSSTAPRDESYFSACWLLEEVDGQPIRTFVKSVIAPAASLPSLRQVLRDASCRADIVAAEEFGFVA
jgi:hypothetical protein